MRSLILVTLLSLVSYNFAHASLDDVTPKFFAKGSRYVRVTVRTPTTVSFEDCISGSEQTTCKTIGPRPVYTVNQLVTQRHWEQGKMAGSGVLDVLAVWGGAVGGLFAGAAIAEGTYLLVGSTYAGAVAGGLITVGTTVGSAAAAPVVLSKAVKALNPVEYYKRSQTVSDSVIQDESVKVDSIDNFIARLSSVLQKAVE